MPKQTLEFYRYRRIYSRDQRYSPHFRKLVDADRQQLLKSLPPDCDTSIAYNSYEHEDEVIEGAFVIDYFEDKDDMMSYKAVVEKDDKIYIDYMKRKKERLLLQRLGYHE